jgi:hypothetical protein
MSSGRIFCSPKGFILPAWRLRGLVESEAGTLWLLRLFHAEIRESTRSARAPRSYQQVTVRRGAGLSLGTRVGLVTASDDHQESRLTGSLPLDQQSRAGAVIGSFLSCCLKSGPGSGALRRERVDRLVPAWDAAGPVGPAPTQSRTVRAPVPPPRRSAFCAGRRSGVCSGGAAGFARPRRGL